MSQIASYRGRVITHADVEFIRQLIAAHPNSSRRALSHQLCEAWNWRQANGQVRDVVCRGLLLMLHRAGHIELPAPLWRAHQPARRTVSRSAHIEQAPIQGDLRTLTPLRFELVRRTASEPLFDCLIREHHYLGYTRPVGEHLKYLVYSGERVVAALTWSSAAHGLSCRDRYIGWSADVRRANRHVLAYNSRFLIPPWIRVPHLASHVLGRMVRQLPGDWERMYHHPIYFVETFVEPARHRGSCYRAANWIVLGQTSGRGHRCPNKQANRPVKLVLGYPLVKHFRELLGNVASGSMEELRHEADCGTAGS